MSIAIFRANFILMVIESILNSAIGILCVEFIYGRVQDIVGWSKFEMLILYCTAMIVNQLFRGIVRPN